MQIQPFYEPALQAEIEAVGMRKTLTKGEVLINIGDYIRYIPILKKGSLKILRQNTEGLELFMYYVNEYETCSMSLTCCMQNKLSGVKAIAESDVELIAIPIKYIEEWIKKYASWRSFIFKSYQNRFNEMLEVIDALAFKKMDERLVEYLQVQVKNNNSSTLHITHQAIATDLNASREAVSRLLKKMENENRIRLGRNRIEVLE